VRCSRSARSVSVRRSSSVRRNETVAVSTSVGLSFGLAPVGVRSCSARVEFLSWQVRQDDQAAVAQQVGGAELAVVWQIELAHSFQQISGVVPVGIVRSHVNVGSARLAPVLRREGFW